MHSQYLSTKNKQIKENAELIKKSLFLAKEYHANQVDKAGEPYIEHLIRVALYVRNTSEYVFDELVATALLHDIIEDSSMTIEELSREIDNSFVVRRVEILTRKKDETYFSYIHRVKEDEYALIIKIADLKDHLIERTDYHLPPSLRDRYERALSILETQQRLSTIPH